MYYKNNVGLIKCIEINVSEELRWRFFSLVKEIKKRFNQKNIIFISVFHKRTIPKFNYA